MGDGSLYRVGPQAEQLPVEAEAGGGGVTVGGTVQGLDSMPEGGGMWRGAA